MRTKTLSFIFITFTIALNTQSQNAGSGGAAAGGTVAPSTGGAVTPATGAGTANRNAQIVQPGTRVVEPGTIRNQSQFPIAGGVATKRLRNSYKWFRSQYEPIDWTNQSIPITDQ